MHDILSEVGRHWVFLTQFDVTKVAPLLKAIELKEQGLLPEKTYYDIFKDVRRCVTDNYHHITEETVHSVKSFGSFFPELSKNVHLYIEPQPELKSIMEELRNSGRKVFLATNSHVEYTNLIMTQTMGVDWQSSFDIVCCYCLKPGFFLNKDNKIPFYSYDST